MGENNKKILYIDEKEDYTTRKIKDENITPCIHIFDHETNKYIEIYRNSKKFDEWDFSYKNKIYNKDNFLELTETFLMDTVIKQIKKADNSLINDNIIDFDEISNKYKIVIQRRTEYNKYSFFFILVQINGYEYIFGYESIEGYTIKYRNKKYTQKKFNDFYFDLLCEFKAYEFIDINRVINVNGNQLNISTNNHNTHINFENLKQEEKIIGNQNQEEICEADVFLHEEFFDKNEFLTRIKLYANEEFINYNSIDKIKTDLILELKENYEYNYKRVAKSIYYDKKDQENFFIIIWYKGKKTNIEITCNDIFKMFPNDKE